ncbi:MAG: FAD-dependent oxidoreductase [Flavobacteriales bacterium]|nr:FAD-dependent oxidoreductase [Flavobacteriales bacterium]
MWGMQHHYTIIGQGLAGTVLAFLLHKKGKAVKIIDDGHRSSCSMIAAGMWNPVSFKRMIPGWKVQEFLPAAQDLYEEMENVLGEKFFHPQELMRIFPDQAAANLWDERSDSPLLSSYLSDKRNDAAAQQFHQPFGHGIVVGSGWLDVKKLLLRAREFFISEDILVEERYEFKQTEGHTIFCTGSLNHENPFFRHLPLRPNKGQLLTIKSDELNVDIMVNFGKFLLPLGGGKFLLGSTYEFDDPVEAPTDSAKEEMLESLGEVFPGRVETLYHMAGYRPTTIDRRPMLGRHPEFSHLGIFNGFGSKGVLLIPYCAHHFIGFLEGKNQLDCEMDIRRFEKR